MPTLKLFTNIPVDPLTTSDILKDATKAVAKIIGKPESYVMILVNGGVPIAFAGTEEPAAFAEIISIGGLGPTVNGKLSSTLADILQEKLSIQSSRFYIKFYDVEVLDLNSMFLRCASQDMNFTPALVKQAEIYTSIGHFHFITALKRSFFGFNGSTF